MPELILRPLYDEDEAVVRALDTQFQAEGFDFSFLNSQPQTWQEYLQRRRDDAAGVNLPEGWVPADFLLAVVAGDIVGRVSIRYELNEFLYQFGGHVGYAVAPAYRRRGYATRMLRLALERLRQRGIDHVLVTCDEDNAASIAVIESCGGVLENRVDHAGRLMRRYWITMAAENSGPR